MLPQFCYILHKKLKNKVKGEVVVYVDNDTLFVSLKSEYSLKFTHKIFHVSEKICNGLSTEMVCIEVLKLYKNFVINKHFK